MNFIANILNYFNLGSLFGTNKNEHNINKEINTEFYHFFINTANIYNATKLLINKLNQPEYKNKSIKIYLLKSDTIEPLLNYYVEVNEEMIKFIKYKLSKKRRHLHTMVDAIDSFIEYNNITNYSIFY